MRSLKIQTEPWSKPSTETIKPENLKAAELISSSEISATSEFISDYIQCFVHVIQ